MHGFTMADGKSYVRESDTNWGEYKDGKRVGSFTGIFQLVHNRLLRTEVDQGTPKRIHDTNLVTGKTRDLDLTNDKIKFLVAKQNQPAIDQPHTRRVRRSLGTDDVEPH